MPKKVFWPVAMIAMGLIVLASNLSLLPKEFWNLWPLILITAGLGGLLTCDRDEWMYEEPQARASRTPAETRQPSRRKLITKKRR